MRENNEMIIQAASTTSGWQLAHYDKVWRLKNGPEMG